MGNCSAFRRQRHGKSTTLGLLTGANKPYRGRVTLDRSCMAALPQNPQTLFVKNTVREDLEEVLSDQKLSKQEKERADWRRGVALRYHSAAGSASL